MSKTLKTSVAAIVLFAMLFCSCYVNAATTHYVRYYWPGTASKIIDDKSTIQSNGYVNLKSFPTDKTTVAKIPDGQVFYKWKIGDKEYEAGRPYNVGNSKDLSAYPVYGYEITTEVTGNVGGKVELDGDDIVKTGAECSFNITADTGYEIDELYIGSSKVNNSTRKFTVSKTAHSIKVTFKKIEYKVTASVSGGNGTITPTESYIKYNESCTFTVSPNTGYMLDTLKVNNGANMSESVSDSKFTLNNIKEEKNVVATYKKIPFNLTVNSTEHAKIDPTGVITVYYGDTKDVTVEADEGYKLVSVTVNNQPVTLPLTDNKVTLTNITEDKTVNVTVEKIKYDVEASVANDGVGGTISVNPTTVEYGDSCVVTLTPDDAQGYEIDHLYVNSQDKTSEISGNQYTIASVTQKPVIEVAYKLKEYDISLENTVENGTVDYDKKVTHGQNCNLVLTPDEGYTLDDVKINGNSVKESVTTTDEGATYTYSYKVTSKDDAKIEVTFKIKTFEVATSVIAGEGTINASPKVVEYGNDCVITLIPAIGYQVDYLDVDGQQVYGITGNSYVQQSIKENHNIKVAYKKLPFTLKIDSVEGATIDPTGSITVLYNESKTVSIKANEGYKLISVKVNGEEQVLPLVDDELILTNITQDKTVEVLVEKIKFQVKTSVVGGNGAITEGKTVEYGDDFLVRLVPARGYMIDKLLINGEEVKAEEDICEFKNIKQDYTVEVSYTKIPFELKIESADNAIINPMGTLVVYYGDNQTINIKASKGYKLVKVTVNGVEQELPLTDDKLELTEITEDTVVVATIEKETYVVMEGKDQTYSNEGELRVRFSGDLDLFVKLLINGVELDESYYTKESGSTIINLSDAYLASLPDGTYEMKAIYSNGNSAQTTFTIARSGNEEQKDDNKINNPTTGDTILLSITIFSISVLGAVLTIRKFKNNK